MKGSSEIPMETTAEKKFLAGMLLSMFCWGISWVSGKILSGYGPAENLSMLRFLLTFISLLILLLVMKENLIIGRKSVPLLLVASLMMTVYSYLFLYGLKHGMPGAGGVLVTTLNPIMAYMLALSLTFTLPGKKESIGLLIGLLAGFILLRAWDSWENVWSAGNLYFVLATIMWTIITRLTAISSRHSSSPAFSLWMFGICTLMMSLVCSPQETVSILKRSDRGFWINLFFSATITTAFATTFFFYATSRIGASKASTYIFLVPFSAALGAWIFIGEIPQWHTIAGGVLGIVAVYVINKKEKI